MPTSLLAIKLHIPATRSRRVARLRLQQRLDDALCCEHCLILVSAPAGFGKTTLLSQWLDRSPLPNVWLQLDEGDHEIPAFLEGIVAALRQLFPDCLRKTADLLMSYGSIPLAVWKSTLIDDLIGMAQKIGVMDAAVVIALLLMLVASGTISAFIHRHPSLKMLALSFLMVIGVTLIAEGLEFHIPKGYIYFAMAFSGAVETLNLIAGNRKREAARS